MRVILYIFPQLISGLNLSDIGFYSVYMRAKQYIFYCLLIIFVLFNVRYIKSL